MQLTQTNVTKVLRNLRTNRLRGVPAISKATGVPRRQVRNILNKLLARGLATCDELHTLPVFDWSPRWLRISTR